MFAHSNDAASATGTYSFSAQVPYFGQRRGLNKFCGGLCDSTSRAIEMAAASRPPPNNSAETSFLTIPAREATNPAQRTKPPAEPRMHAHMMCHRRMLPA